MPIFNQHRCRPRCTVYSRASSIELHDSPSELHSRDDIKDVGQKVHGDAELRALGAAAVENRCEHGRQHARQNGDVEDVVVDLGVFPPHVVVEDRHQVAVGAQRLEEEAADEGVEPRAVGALGVYRLVFCEALDADADERAADGQRDDD